MGWLYFQGFPDFSSGDLTVFLNKGQSYILHLKQKNRVNQTVWVPWWNRKVFLLGVIILIISHPFIDLRRCSHILRIAMRSNWEEFYFKQAEVCRIWNPQHFHTACSVFFVMHWHLCFRWHISLIHPFTVHCKTRAKGVWLALCFFSPRATVITNDSYFRHLSRYYSRTAQAAIKSQENVQI